MATELENRGHDLNHHLWSAQLLIHKPQEIAAVHRTYLEAGADCLISASYQASISGFVSEGLSEKEATFLIKKTVSIACEVRDDFFFNLDDNKRIRPLVAASIGPYGAYLANGAEYRGDYNCSSDKLKDFHLPRWELLSNTSADLFACETIPSFQEAEVLKSLLQCSSDIQAWMSFSCIDGMHISDGTPIEECVSLLEDCNNLVAIGVNCTAPEHIDSLITNLLGSRTSKKIIVYPNSGEPYDPLKKKWLGKQSVYNFGKYADIWYKSGACMIGGCCRTGPKHISAMRKALVKDD